MTHEPSHSITDADRLGSSNGPAPTAASTGVPALSRRAFVGAVGLAAAGVALGSARRAGASEGVFAAGEDQVVIFHTNDTHGYLEGDGDTSVGIDLVAGLRAATPNSLLLDAGDATQGAPLASLTKGSAPIDLMNAAGYDAMCLGNHEFDFGLDNLLANVGAARFPVLGANVLRAGTPLLDGVADAVGTAGNGANAVLECGGRRIGVFGLTTQATAWSVSPDAVTDVTFADEVEIAQAQIAELAGQGVDAIVCLAHLGNGDVPCTAPELAQSLPAAAASQLTAIIDGHSHTVENDLINGVLVVQTGCNLAAVGRLTLTFAADGSVEATEELLDPATAAAQATPDADVTADLEAVTADQQELLSERLCVNPTTLWAGWLSDSDLSAPTRMVETNYGDFVCECFINRASAFLAQAGLDDGTPLLAVTNGGGIRAAMPRGVVTMGDLVSAFPFSNTLQVKRITPKTLRTLLEASLATMDGQDTQSGLLLQETISGSFLQLAGFEVACDPNAPVGQRVTDIYVYGLADSVDLDDDVTPLYLASNSYVMAGGDSYEALACAELVAEVGGELEAVEAYIGELSGALGRRLGTKCLPPLAGTKGRLIFDGYEPKAWVATLRLVDEAGEPLADTDVLLDVDASGCVRTTSDAEGYVQVELEDGPHAIAAFEPDGAVAMAYGVAEGIEGIGYAAYDVLVATGLVCDGAGAGSGETDASAGVDAGSGFIAGAGVDSGKAGARDTQGAGDGEGDAGRSGLTGALVRAVLEPASEAYVDNHMGIGLVEDDLRTFPTVTLTPMNEAVQSYRGAVAGAESKLHDVLSSDGMARFSSAASDMAGAASDMAGAASDMAGAVVEVVASVFGA